MSPPYASCPPWPASAAPVRVLIADDSFVLREGLAQLLALSPRVTVIGRHADAASLLAAIDANPPDVVLTDIRMPPTHTDEGMQVAERLDLPPGVGVVVVSQHGSAQYAASCWPPVSAAAVTC